MKNEINQKKGARIYCIYFENEEYRSNSTEEPITILKKISELGGTQAKIYSANSVTTLVEAFTNVSNAIEINFKLEYLKKNK